MLNLLNRVRLFQSQEALYKIKVGLVHDAVLVEGTFALLRLLGKNVSFKRLLVGDLSRAGYFKPFFGARVRFNLWHYCLFYFYTLLAFRTGGNLWSLVGNPAHSGKRAAKLW